MPLRDDQSLLTLIPGLSPRTRVLRLIDQGSVVVLCRRSPVLQNTCIPAIEKTHAKSIATYTIAVKIPQCTTSDPRSYVGVVTTRLASTIGSGISSGVELQCRTKALLTPQPEVVPLFNTHKWFK